MKKIILFSIFAFFLAPSLAGAATMTVTASAPDVVAANGVCSLREAITAANNNVANVDCPAVDAFGNNTIILGNDTIILPAGTYTISLPTSGCEDADANGDFDIVNTTGTPETLTITGAGAATTIINANKVDRVFDLVISTVSPIVTISGVTIENGVARDCTGTFFNSGGGIRVQAGSLTLTDVVVNGNDAINGGGIQINNPGIPGTGIINRSTISNNNANQAIGTNSGGGVNSFGVLTMINTTVSGNHAEGDGGGLAVEISTNLRNVTITNNTADFSANGIGDGGGIALESDTGPAMIIRNSIVAGNFDNSPMSVAPDCANVGATFFTSQGFNLLGDTRGGCTFTATGDQTGVAPLLGPLASNGGPTPTHVLLTGSPAIDRGNNIVGCTSDDAQTVVLTEDQRSFLRPLDGNNDGIVVCDIGAVEIGCGNGVVETTELCDDGNTSNNDACLNTCIPASCGDGFVETGVEACDDGNRVNNDACTNACALPTCGDGILQAGEACDNGAANSNTTPNACRTNCTNPRCGDGVVDTGERCDDGNTSNNDACLNTCVPASCGDGFIETGVEQCDDGNTAPNDGCSPTCATESLPVSTLYYYLGDGGCSLVRSPLLQNRR